MISTLNVYWGERLVGRLMLDEKRRYSFQYDSVWVSSKAPRISTSLPLRAEAYRDDVARNFFSNLLPEQRVRTLIAKQLGVSDGNDFKLLEELGGDCAGALSLLPEGQMPRTGGGYKSLSDDELDAKIEEMPRRPLLTATEGVRLSLAGAQNKLPVFVQDGKIFLPLAASPSSHILKPKIPEFEDTVENEGFCMMLAKECGLPVPEVSIRAGKHRCLLVSRYDRTLLDGRLTRLHQEDFCQALGFSHNEKYQKDGGPGLKQCFDLLEEHSAEPILDKRNLLRGVVFNYLIGNADAHAKNISLLISEEGLRLAPFYDLMSTVVYRKLAKELAMKVGGEDRPDWIAKRHWERIAGEAAVTPKAIIEICAELGEVLPDKTELLAKPFIAEHGAESTVSTIATYSTATSKRLRDGLNSH